MQSARGVCALRALVLTAATFTMVDSAPYNYGVSNLRVLSFSQFRIITILWVYAANERRQLYNNSNLTVVYPSLAQMYYNYSIFLIFCPVLLMIT